MIDYLSTAPNYSRPGRAEAFAFAFNVKLHGLDLSMATLFNLAVTGRNPLINLSMVAPSKADEIKCEFADSYARLDAGKEQVYYQSQDACCLAITQGPIFWPGEDAPLKSAVGFVGRSNGWLALHSYDGYEVSYPQQEVLRNLRATYATGQQPTTWGYEIDTSIVVGIFKSVLMLEQAAQERYKTFQLTAASLVVEAMGAVC